MDNIILYLLTVIQEQYKTICWLLNFICRYILSSSGPSMIPTPLNTTNLPLTASLSSSLSSNKTGSSYWNTTSGNMVKPSGRSSGAMGNPFPRIPSVPLCGAPHHYLYDNNGGNGQVSVQGLWTDVCHWGGCYLQSVSCALTVDTPLSRKRTGGSSASTNVSIQSVLSICITSPGLIKNIWMRITVKINTSSITSTGNSPWISSA